VLPDFQELGCRQLGQVQVRGLLLRASHGEPLGDLRQHSAVARHSSALTLALGLRATLPLYAVPSCAAPRRRQGARGLRESRRGAARRSGRPGLASAPGARRSGVRPLYFPVKMGERLPLLSLSL
jgi:hypothetical protein